MTRTRTMIMIMIMIMIMNMIMIMIMILTLGLQSPALSPHPSSLTPSLLNPYISPIALHMPSAAESKINNEI